MSSVMARRFNTGDIIYFLLRNPLWHCTPPFWIHCWQILLIVATIIPHSFLRDMAQIPNSCCLMNSSFLGTEFYDILKALSSIPFIKDKSKTRLGIKIMIMPKQIVSGVVLDVYTSRNHKLYENDTTNIFISLFETKNFEKKFFELDSKLCKSAPFLH